MPSIAELLFDAEKGQIHIPDFQRPWVWNKDKVRRLFTSLYRRYPVGAMVFWPNRTNGDQRHSLIDGRQRLTALYHVIQGRRPPWMRETPSEFAEPLGFNVIDEEFGYLSDKLDGDERWISVSDAFVIADFVERFDSAGLCPAEWWVLGLSLGVGRRFDFGWCDGSGFAVESAHGVF